ncbi:MAG: phosphonate ABC transporter, permease protein PhnE [Chloroflexi bacterium]|nr:phosphonate ABC transporter, permease protein PhnE [Chloroflexota bacterium]
MSRPSSKNPNLAGLLALAVPGLGHLYLGLWTRGLVIFVTTLTLAYVVSWALESFKIALLALAGVNVSWLWAPFGAFWLWNVLDAYRRAQQRAAPRLWGFLLPALIVYVIAWQVTDVNLQRLVTRFGDAKIILSAIVQPDLFARDQVSQIGGAPIWVPCSEPPQPPLETGYSGYPVRLDKSCATVGETVTIFGEGFVPGATGNLHWLSFEGANEAQIRAGGQAVAVTVDPDGRFQQSFPVPTFAGLEGLDPQNPLLHSVEARFTQEVGAYHPSENFGDLIGKISQEPPPQVLVQLGLVSADALMPTPLLGDIFETIAIGLMATLFSIVIAVPISFLGAHNLMARVPGGNAIYYAARAIFNITRSIDTLIWGIIVVIWVGLGSFAGVIALTIHSVAALAKLFSEEIEHIDEGPVEAITATGGNLLQVIRYAVFPQIVPPFLAYALLRWDINMRAATVVGFVAGGGIGFFVIETVRKGGYAQYAAALWVVAIVIMAVDYLSARWRKQILEGETRISSEPPKAWYRTFKGWAYAVGLSIAFVVSWNLAQIDLRKMFDPGPTFGKVVSDFITIDTSPPVLAAVIKQLLITVFQALLATTLGAIVAIPFSFLAARNLMSRTRLSSAIYNVARFILNFLRSIEALLYVAIFVFWVGIGPFAGMLALAVTTFALIGKLFSEAIENIDAGPLEAVTATGATRIQTIMYAVIPQIIPPWISYAIYQWDINIRIATIIGLAGGAGIGLLFINYAGQLQYHKAGTVVLAIVIVVTLMDFVSAKIRQKLV